ncbi:DUF4435 domain-containing protein [Commensalibacter nepenthis]|uniref:DUF4435 domain-containing protein n=1 Tax=Commensalibacter nepenthis TaxID=3043872 RepID=A0ABT6Q6Q9_9PROT|nr:DUF4435 domain-containing protein [Commensalibacter sp. TBRC 10068]MDI2112584.1 DUF4435 domain-containing protein [Commensalibacter sp. TBRC 10068]
MNQSDERKLAPPASTTQVDKNAKLFTIKLPKKGALQEIDTPQSLLFIGANGSGKTRLGAWIDTESKQKERVHRISAQKSLAMPDDTQITSAQNAIDELYFGGKEEYRKQNKSNFRWNSKPAITPLDDYKKLLTYLFSEHAEKSIQYLQESKKSTQKVEPPITNIDKVQKTWEKFLPHRELIIGNAKVQTKIKGSESNVYNCSEMSDGERVIFYLIGQCLAAPENGIIIIDEPEIHLHKSIQVPLWREIESLRPDCLFIYMTHDVDFAAAFSDAKKIWLKNYDGKSWDWEEIPDVAGLPEALLIEILGSRKPVVFVEGENGSYDASLYRALLDDFLVIPSGSCSQVIQKVKALKESSQLHHMEVFGLIDRDRRTAAEITSLKDSGIYTLEVAEVENLFCVPEIITLISEKFERNPNEDKQAVEKFIIKAVKSELETQISLQVAGEIKYQLNCFNEKAKGIEGLTQALETLTSNIKNKIEKFYNNLSSQFNEAIDTHNYLLLLKLYNRKSLASQVSECLGLSNGEIQTLVLRMVKGKNSSKVKEALKPYFGEFASKIK